MLLKTIAEENYFNNEFVKSAKKILSDEGSPYTDKDKADFLNLSLSKPIGNALREFNYTYFNFPHQKRVGMYDDFDKPSEENLDKLVNKFKEFFPLSSARNLKILYSLTCAKILEMIEHDLITLGDKEYAEFINLEQIKVLEWGTKL